MVGRLVGRSDETDRPVGQRFRPYRLFCFLMRVRSKYVAHKKLVVTRALKLLLTGCSMDDAGFLISGARVHFRIGKEGRKERVKRRSRRAGGRAGGHRQTRIVPSWLPGNLLAKKPSARYLARDMT
jgi:hypothetical protein